MASLSAHPTVLVVGGMLLTLVAAQAAGFCTSLKSRPRHLLLEGRLTREDASRGVADVGTVEVESDAVGEGLRVVLAEAGVGASRTALGAVVAGFYALHQRGGVHRGGTRVGLEHLLGGSRSTPSSRMFTSPYYSCLRAPPHTCAGLIVGKDSVEERSITSVMYSLCASRISCSDALRPYSPKCLVDEFCELRLYGVLRSTEIFLFSVPYRRVGFICRYGKRPL
jgi:hypothetical protein